MRRRVLIGSFAITLADARAAVDALEVELGEARKTLHAGMREAYAAGASTSAIAAAVGCAKSWAHEVVTTKEK